MIEPNIEYQGRQTKRRGSEQRRQAILEAALRIIVTEGIRSVRHRAVAREADVPLSATTYYFKDITDLISDTFTFFAERAIKEVITPFKEATFAMLSSAADGKDSPGKRAELLDQLADAVCQFIQFEVTEQHDHLIAEQAFLYEAILNPRLAELATHYVQEQRNALTQALELLGSRTADLDGEILMSVFFRMENRLLTDDSMDIGQVREHVRRALELLVP